MLLTDEEIRQELAKLPDNKRFLPSAYEETSIRWNEFVAKAQVKKLVEWGGEGCPHNLSPEGMSYDLKHECLACWQSLLKEVNDAQS